MTIEVHINLSIFNIRHSKMITETQSKRQERLEAKVYGLGTICIILLCPSFKQDCENVLCIFKSLLSLIHLWKPAESAKTTLTSRNLMEMHSLLLSAHVFSSHWRAGWEFYTLFRWDLLIRYSHMGPVKLGISSAWRQRILKPCKQNYLCVSQNKLSLHMWAVLY